MKRRALPLCALALNVLLAPGLSLRAAENPDAEFLRIYSLMQEGETLEQGGQSGPAAERFREARRELGAFAKAHPGWNRKIIQFRLEYLDSKVGMALAPDSGPAKAATTRPTPTMAVPEATPAAGVPVASKGAGEAVPPAASVDAVALRERATASEARAAEAIQDAERHRDQAAQLALDLRQAREQLEVAEFAKTQLEQTRSRLETERVTLEARLKEALGPRPAALDPSELAKAEERILLLVKENEILKAGLDWQTAENRRVLEKAGKAIELEQQLAAVRGELSQQKRQNDDLRSERQKIQSKYDQLARKSDEQADSLKADIESLRKELAAARTATRSGAGDGGRETASLRTELAQQKASAEKLRRENQEMAKELAELTAIQITPASLKVAEVPELSGTEGARVRRLERERDDLRRELDTVRAELRRVEAAPGARKQRESARDVERLTARVAALEAKAEPYSPEEWALFRAPTQSAPPRAPVQLAMVGAETGGSAPTTPSSAPASGAPTAGASGTTNVPTASVASTNAPTVRRRTTKDLPPGASIMAAQAERAFRQRRLDEAEKAYRDILKLDESNVFTLANLGAILVELGRLEEAERFLKRALEGDAQDAFSLSLMGIIRFRQQKFEEAFDALSRSAALDPESSDTQNYLGITLSQRGQRTAAEAALRKAIKLNPASASAHYNLSVVYATQKPPFLELARYHYEKARRSGQPANPAFEALLKGDGAGTQGGAPTSPKP